MRPFLSATVTPAAPAKRLTSAAQVREAMSSGAWFTRKELVALTGLGDGVVNTAIHAGLRRGQVEREVPDMGRRQKTIVQRYRATGGRG